MINILIISLLLIWIILLSFRNIDLREERNRLREVLREDQVYIFKLAKRVEELHKKLGGK